ncbi:hypothetical protein U2F10_27450 [Leptothoe sp. EHU-05/26/07-4]|uniref:Uncharacterized protein n=1 Tax=Adonisia turfae CCMR0081 TaxID=2292702 RepID=A0A6M0RJY8_9CYAN|nr:hypothetical protein [Adonisia turfae CCMR0081]
MAVMADAGGRHRRQWAVILFRVPSAVQSYRLQSSAMFFLKRRASDAAAKHRCFAVTDGGYELLSYL